MTRIANRDAWIAQIRFPSGSGFTQPWTWWVDKQTGILLKSIVSGNTKQFANVTIDGPVGPFHDPIVPKGYAIQGFLDGTTVQTVVPRSEPLSHLLATLRSH